MTVVQPPSAGVIGWPVAHSKSPLIHRFWLEKLGLDGDYGRFPVHPDHLGEAIRALPALGLRGAALVLVEADPHDTDAEPALQPVRSDGMPDNMLGELREAAGSQLAVELAREGDGRQMQALLPIPQQIARFITLPGGKRFVRLEEVLLMHLPSLFPGYRDIGHCAFRVLRDSDLEVEEEAEDLVR